MATAAEALGKVRQHFNGKRKGEGVSLSIEETSTILKDDAKEFLTQLSQTRAGFRANGKKGKRKDVSLETALRLRYGCSKTIVLADGVTTKEVGDLKAYLHALGVDTKSTTLEEFAQDYAGYSSFNISEFANLLEGHNIESFANPANKGEIDPSFRFLIPEIIAQAIRTGYVHSSMAEMWISSTQPMPQMKLVMPRIERGNGIATRVAEGANIPMGSLRFGKKEVSVFKVGTGFSMTDELVTASSIDMLFEFLQEAGNDMAICRDVEALRVLTNGEQADGSESTPVIGVASTSDGIQLLDVDRVKERMTRLARPVSRMITSETQKNRDLNSSYPNRERTKLADYTKLPVDCHVLPTTDQLLFLSGQRCMVELKHRNMLIERNRNKGNQTEEVYISDYVGFAKLRRDGAVILDGAVAYSATVGAAGGFPAYMDIDARITESFKTY